MCDSFRPLALRLFEWAKSERRTLMERYSPNSHVGIGYVNKKR